jgi:2-polyprenyl-3-methyl-5-hydroxy-6-metoxy-1,4-benzoquinol methylase
MNKTKEKTLWDYRKITGRSFLHLNKYMYENFPKNDNSLSVYYDFIKPILDKSDKVLDVGCGNGTLTRICDANKIYGIDLDKGKIDEYYAKEKNVNAAYFLGSCEQIPFKSDTFDTVLCHSVAEHLKVPEVAYVEFSRILKNGGKLIILTTNTLNPIYFANKFLLLSVKEKINAIISSQVNRTPTYYKTNRPKIMDNQLKSCGFEKKKLIRAVDVPVSLKNPYRSFWKYSNKLFFKKLFNAFLPIFCAIYEKKI